MSVRLRFIALLVLAVLFVIWGITRGPKGGANPKPQLPASIETSEERQRRHELRQICKDTATHESLVYKTWKAYFQATGGKIEVKTAEQARLAKVAGKWFKEGVRRMGYDRTVEVQNLARFDAKWGL